MPGSECMHLGGGLWAHFFLRWMGCEGDKPSHLHRLLDPADLIDYQQNVGDPSEQTWQAKGVVHAAGVVDPQDVVKTCLEQTTDKQMYMED